MVEVIVVCEGRAEETFVREVLGAELAHRSVFLQPRLMTTSPGHRGGALSRDRVVRYLCTTLRERRDVYVTTLFDLYGLPSGFPGQGSSDGKADPIERAASIEQDLHEIVVQSAKCRPDRFLPHIQPHEFESLLFSDVAQFAEVEPDWQSFLGVLRNVQQTAPSPEHINDGQDTHPSARLRQVLGASYQKVLHGAAVSAQIGLERIRAECRHFREWLTRLEELPPLREDN